MFLYPSGDVGIVTGDCQIVSNRFDVNAELIGKFYVKVREQLGEAQLVNHSLRCKLTAQESASVNVADLSWLSAQLTVNATFSKWFVPEEEGAQGNWYYGHIEACKLHHKYPYELQYEDGDFETETLESIFDYIKAGSWQFRHD